MEPNKLDEIIKKLGQNTPEPRENAMYKVLEFFVSEQGILGKTKITAKQQNMLYMYSLMHLKHPKWGLENASKTLGLLFISRDGESRHGMIKLFQGLMSQMREESVSLDISKNQGEMPKK